MDSLFKILMGQPLDPEDDLEGMNGQVPELEAVMDAMDALGADLDQQMRAHDIVAAVIEAKKAGLGVDDVPNQPALAGKNPPTLLEKEAVKIMMAPRHDRMPGPTDIVSDEDEPPPPPAPAFGLSAARTARNPLAPKRDEDEDDDSRRSKPKSSTLEIPPEPIPDDPLAWDDWTQGLNPEWPRLLALVRQAFALALKEDEELRTIGQDVVLTHLHTLESEENVRAYGKDAVGAAMKLLRRFRERHIALEDDVDDEADGEDAAHLPPAH